MKGICHVSQIPVRSDAKSSSEMVTQLLFGETYSVLKSENDWHYIKLDFDGYEGWISGSSFHTLTSDISLHTQITLESSDFNPFIAKTIVKTSMGSLIGKHTNDARYRLADLAIQFLGCPYLWGGRHYSGIDCSGFMQVIFKCNKINLPRDASQQQKVGKPIHFSKLTEGDLIFFHIDNKVKHVGLYLGNDQIIHAHGYVRIDSLTKKGIVNSKTKKLTHHYFSAKRVS